MIINELSRAVFFNSGPEEDQWYQLKYFLPKSVNFPNRSVNPETSLVYLIVK